MGEQLFITLNDYVHNTNRVLDVINCKQPFKVGDTFRSIVREPDYESRKAYEGIVRSITNVNNIECVGVFGNV